MARGTIEVVQVVNTGNPAHAADSNWLSSTTKDIHLQVFPLRRSRLLPRTCQ